MTQIQSTGKLLNYKDFVTGENSLWESGAAAGDGIQRALDAGFKGVCSIEASKSYYNFCANRFKYNYQVVVLLGKSVDIFKECKDVIPHDAVIFLDAHVSGETSAGYEDWIEKGEESDYAQDKTIKAELAIILANNSKHVIIIDDVNGLTDGHAIEYAEIMQKANPDYKFQFYDENLICDPAYYYKDKLLVAIPK